MKKRFEEPTIEIILFEPEDIMVSGLVNGGDGTGDMGSWAEIY